MDIDIHMGTATTRDEPLLDFAAEIAKGANMLLQIDNGDLRVVNRIQTGAAVATVRNPELLSLQVAPAFPIKKIYTEYEYNTPYPDSVTLAQEERYVEVKNLSYGEEQEYTALSRSEGKVLEYLRAILISEASPICSARVFGVKSDWLLGQRVTCIDERQGIQSTITITSIVYQFDQEETTISGPSDIEFVKEI